MEKLHSQFQLPGQRPFRYVHRVHKGSAIHDDGEEFGSGGKSMFYENRRGVHEHMVYLQTPLSKQVTLEKALGNLLLALLAPAEEHVTPPHPL